MCPLRWLSRVFHFRRQILTVFKILQAIGHIYVLRLLLVNILNHN